MSPRRHAHLARGCATLAAATLLAVPTAARAQAQPDLTQPPTLGAVKPLRLPPVVTRQLPNGLRILVVEHHELPIADATLIFKSGAEADPADRAGLATLTASLLKEGTTSRSSLAIADQEAFLGASLFASSGWDATTISLHTPTAQLDSALALFADVALRPAFPEQELERLRKTRLTSLLQLRDRGPAIADLAFASTVYGPSAAYGHPLSGTETSTQAITRADVQRFYETYFRPNNATLLVVGDVTPDDVERRARALFGGWERRDVPPANYGQPSAPTQTAVYLVDKPGAAQSSFRIGTVGVPRSTADYFPLVVLNTALGGSFTSRLNQNLRETKGYTYGASSNFAFRRVAGPFTASAEIVSAKTDSALIEFMKELRAIRDTIPTAELENTKRYIQLQLPGRFETTGGIAGQLAPLIIYDLPLDYFDSYTQRVAAVTQADVQRVARTYLDPAKLAIVIVGDRKSVESGLKSTGIAPVETKVVDWK